MGGGVRGDLSWDNICFQLNNEAGTYIARNNLMGKYHRMKRRGLGEDIPMDARRRRGFGTKEVVVDGNVMTLEELAHNTWMKEGNRGTGNKGGLCWSDIASFVNGVAGLDLSLPVIRQMTYKYRDKIWGEERRARD